MNNKLLPAFLVFIVAALFFAFNRPVVKTAEHDANISLPFSKTVDNQKKIGKPLLACNRVKPKAANMIFQSTDGGRTWQDISETLPESEQPHDFFANESEIYLRIMDDMYRSTNNLETPVWEKENALDLQSPSIAFTRSGVIAFNHDGHMYRKTSAAGTWVPVYTTFKKHLVRTIFETSDGTVFIGSDFGLHKSTDKGRSWKQVFEEGWVMDVAESDGVLIATSQSGIIRSTDNGEHWKTVINEGGVGIDVERIEGGFASISFNSSLQSRRIHISMDNGKTWEAIDGGLEPSLLISSIKQVGGYLICGHPNGIFRSSDMGKTWNSVHPNVGNSLDIYGKPWMSVPSINNGKLFRIYVSGDVLYAVAGKAGC